MSTPVAGIRYSWDALLRQWVAPGRAPLAGGSRDDLAAMYGKYDADETTTGLSRPDAVLTQVYPSSPDSPIQITQAWLDARGITGAAFGVAMVRDYEFWGRVQQLVPGIFYDNSAFRGANPEFVSQARACIQSSGVNPPHWRAKDCIIDPSAWPNFGIAQEGRGNCYINGIAGANYTLERTLIRNVNDAFQLVGPTGVEGDRSPADAARTRVLGCLWDTGYWMSPFGLDVGGFSDNQPHSDGVQIMTGKHYYFMGNTGGGTRVPEGYVIPGGTNLGKDYGNAGVMITQELGVEEYRLIDDVLFEDNVFEGSVATVNFSYNTSRPNHCAGVVFRRNRFKPRGSNWGPPSNPTSGGIHGNLSQTNFWGQAYENTIYGTGAPAPGMNK